jgi:hypothetical protein
MTSDSRLKVAIVGDDRAHLHLARALADAVTREHITAHVRPWPDPDALDEARVWHLHEGKVDLIRLGELEYLFEAETQRSKRPLKRTHRVAGQAVGPLANLADACTLLAVSQDPPDVVLGLVDGDSRSGAAERAKHLQLVLDFAREKTPSFKAVVFGATIPCAEAWLVSILGAAPRFSRRRALVTTELKLDPVTSPELLNTDKSAPQHAKRVLNFLLDQDQGTLMEASAKQTPKEHTYAPSLADTPLSLSQLAALSPCGLAPFVTRLREDYAPQVCS